MATTNKQIHEQLMKDMSLLISSRCEILVTIINRMNAPDYYVLENRLDCQLIDNILTGLNHDVKTMHKYLADYGGTYEQYVNFLNVILNEYFKKMQHRGNKDCFWIVLENTTYTRRNWDSYLKRNNKRYIELERKREAVG